MHEIRKSIFSQAQKWAFNSGSAAVGDNPRCGSVLEGKFLRPAYATQSYKEESLALSSHPFGALKEIKDSGSLCMDGLGVNTFHSSQSKPMRNFDLERLPEDNVDESEIQVESNSFGTPVTNSTLSKRTLDTDKNPFLAADSSLKMDSPSSKQMYPETDSRILSNPSQKINQDCDRALGGKVCGVDMKKCATGSQNLDNITKNNTSGDFPPNYVVSNHSTCTG